MKRMLSALMAILMLLGCVPVLADGSVYSGMPQGVQEYLIQALRFDDFTIDAHIRPAGGDTTFVAITDDGIRRLMCFELGDGQWTLRWNRKNAMPVTSGDVSLREMSGVTMGGVTLGTAFAIRDMKNQWECVYEQSGKTWQLRLICWHDTDDTILETYRVESGVVKYEGWRKEGQQRIYGTFQSDLRYFSWQDFPFDPDELRTALSNPPRIPEGPSHPVYRRQKVSGLQRPRHGLRSVRKRQCPREHQRLDSGLWRGGRLDHDPVRHHPRAHAHRLDRRRRAALRQDGDAAVLHPHPGRGDHGHEPDG